MFRNAACILLIAVASLAAYLPAARYGFVLWDDDINVYENPLLNPPAAQKTAEFWQKPFRGLYIPLTYTVWSALASAAYDHDILAYGIKLDPRFFHGANVALHAANAVLVFLILKIFLRNMFRPAAPGGPPDGREPEIPAMMGALFFSLHPLAVEPVAWVTGMKDVLCGFFSLVSFQQYLLYLERSAEARPAGEHRGPLHYLASVFFFLLALLAKPSAVALVPALFIAGVAVFGLTFLHGAKPLLIWIPPVLAAAAVSKAEQADKAGDFVASLPERFLIAGDSVAFYLYKLVFPAELAIDYGRTPQFVLGQWWGHYTWMIPVALLFLVLTNGRRRHLLAAYGIFVLSFLPVLGFVPFTFQNFSTVADRYAYLPLTGASLFAAWFLSARKGRVITAAFMAIICLLAFQSRRQLAFWRSSPALFEHTLKINPDSFYAHLNYGSSDLLEGRPEQAARHFAEAARIRPLDETAHNNLGLALAQTGRAEKAVAEYLVAVKLRPDYGEAHVNLGVAYAALGDAAGAETHFRQGVILLPERPGVYNNLGKALLLRGKAGQAAAQFKKALEIKPDFTEARRNLEYARMRAEETGK